MKTMWKRAGAAVGALAMLSGVMVAFSSGAGAAPAEKVTICHRTNSVTNPYTVNSVPESSIDGEKNNDHTLHVGPVFDFSDPDQYTPPFNGDEWGDIIPPHPANGNVGQNWTELAYEGGPTGEQIHAAGCQAPDQPDEDPTASLTIEKVVTGADAPATWSFDFGFTTGETDLGDFTLTEAGSETSYPALDLGDHTVTETLPDDFELTDVDCGEATVVPVEGGVTVTLADGDDVTCTFTNTYTAPEEPVITEEPVVEPASTPPAVEGNKVVTAPPAPAVKAETTQLAFTGSGDVWLALTGGALVLLGMALVAGSRRREALES